MKTQLQKSMYAFLMSAFCLFCSTDLIAQSFVINSPASIEGSYIMEPGNFGRDLIDSVWTGELEFVNDTTAGNDPTEGCDGPLANNLAGKIAVIDRGGCSFGLKCLNAENAGAIATVVCNNVPGIPISMGAGSSGGMVTIPCLMISKDDCDVIRSVIMAGGVIATLGNIVFENNLSISVSSVIMPPLYAIPSSQLQNANDYIFYTGARVTNTGTNPQANTTVTGTVEFGGSNLYSESSSTASLAPGADTLLVMSNYDPSMSSNGIHTFDYEVSSDSVDGFSADNTVNNGFMITDSIFSPVPIDPATGIPLPSNSSIRSSAQQDYEWGIMIRTPHGTGHTALKGSFAFNAGGPNLNGEVGTMNLYRWDDLNGDNNLEDAELTAVGFSNPYNFTTEDDYEFVTVNLFDFITFNPGIALEDGKTYLLSVAYNGVNDVFMARNRGIDLSEYADRYEADQGIRYIVSPAKTTDWNSNGFGQEDIPAFVLHTTQYPVATTKLPLGNFDFNILTNPVKDQLNVQLKLNSLSPNLLYEITDATGRILYSETRQNVDQDLFTYDVSDFATGSYLITVKTNQGFKTAQFIVAN